MMGNESGDRNHAHKAEDPNAVDWRSLVCVAVAAATFLCLMARCAP